MVKFGDLTLTSLETITAFDIQTGDFLWQLDELQNTTISNSDETTDVTGKNGRLLNTLKRNKAVTVTGTNGLLSGGLLETQTGSKFENKVTSIMYPDYLVVNENKATTSYKAVGAAGNEIGVVLVHNNDGSVGESFTQDATAGEGTFSYDPETKEITFSAGALDDGTEIAVYYYRNITADVMDNKSDTYAGKASLYIDAFAEDVCNKVYHVQFYFPQADFNGTFDLEFSDTQLVHAFETRSLAGGCGRSAGSASLWTLTVFGEDTEDAA